MPIESSPTYISDLNALWPLENDAAAQGDNHLRSIKGAIQATFPNITGEVTVTQAKINWLDTVDLTSADFTKLAALTASAAEINKLAGNAVLATDLTKLSQVTADATELNRLDGVTGTLIHSANKDTFTYPAATLNGQPGSYYEDGSSIKTGTITHSRIPKATQAQAEAGATNEWFLTPAMASFQIAAQVKLFQSTSLPYVKGQNSNKAHGLGQLPHFVTARLRCNVPEGGYSAGDEIHMTSGCYDAESDTGFTLTCDANQIYVSVAAGGPALLVKKSLTGERFIPATDRWEWRFCAVRLP